MAIKHNVYFDGAVQSIAHISDKGVTVMSVGIVLPGGYDFGNVERRETIVITSGALYLNGSWLKVGERRVVEVGGRVNIICSEPSSYTCFYG